MGGAGGAVGVQKLLRAPADGGLGLKLTMGAIFGARIRAFNAVRAGTADLGGALDCPERLPGELHSGPQSGDADLREEPFASESLACDCHDRTLPNRHDTCQY